KEIDIKVETTIEQNGEVRGPREGLTYLKTIIIGRTTNDQEVFGVEVVYEGRCQAKTPIDEKELRFYLEVQAVPMLWSFTRETVNNMTMKMGIKPILLPALNITDMLKHLSQQNEIKDDER
ncbi:MAG: protein-export chaperone SecB, partial [Cellulosilyticaceae bacterium]